MAKFFKTITHTPNESELKDIYDLYKYNAEAMGDKPMPYKAFLKTPNLNVFVEMKCLNCHSEYQEHFGDYALEMEAMELPFPIDWCPDCMKQYLVPKDIYNKLIK